MQNDPVKHLRAWEMVFNGVENIWLDLTAWISFLHHGLNEVHQEYPFMFYRTDWRAFAHLAIAVAFIGPLHNPVRNIWVIQFGKIACLMLVPLALIFSPIRGIPWFWIVIDCSFGVQGILPLLIAYRQILRIVALEKGALHRL